MLHFNLTKVTCISTKPSKCWTHPWGTGSRRLVHAERWLPEPPPPEVIDERQPCPAIIVLVCNNKLQSISGRPSGASCLCHCITLSCPLSASWLKEKWDTHKLQSWQDLHLQDVAATTPELAKGAEAISPAHRHRADILTGKRCKTVTDQGKKLC